jgi:hypothetical protein
MAMKPTSTAVVSVRLVLKVGVALQRAIAPAPCAPMDNVQQLGAMMAFSMETKQV